MKEERHDLLVFVGAEVSLDHFKDPLALVGVREVHHVHEAVRLPLEQQVEGIVRADAVLVAELFRRLAPESDALASAQMRGRLAVLEAVSVKVHVVIHDVD